MNVGNPFFNVSTFVSDEAAGLLPVTWQSLHTVVDAMQTACYGPNFNPGRCAALSRQVGRIRMQNQCLRAQGARAPAVPAVVANPSSPAAVMAALAAVGARPPTSLAAAMCR